jgi:hypothetical protein
MQRSTELAPPLDPMNFAPAVMTWWRMALFDMPLAYAAETNAFMERWAALQNEYFQRLSGSRTLDEVAQAQTAFLDKSVDGYAQSAKAISRDLTITLAAANA